MGIFSWPKTIKDAVCRAISLWIKVGSNEVKVQSQETILALQARVAEFQTLNAKLECENALLKKKILRLETKLEQFIQGKKDHAAHDAEKAGWQLYRPTPGVFLYAVSPDGDPATPYDGSFECFCRKCADEHHRKSVLQKTGHSGSADRYTCPACGFFFLQPWPDSGTVCFDPLPESSCLM